MSDLRWRRWLLVAFGATLWAAPAHACRCREPSPRTAYRDAHLVILGQVIDKAPDGQGRFTVVVEKSWKGSAPRTLPVRDGEVCSLDPDVGVRYVLFLRRDNDGYETGRCVGDAPGDRAGPTQQFLDATPTVRMPRRERRPSRTD